MQLVHIQNHEQQSKGEEVEETARVSPSAGCIGGKRRHPNPIPAWEAQSSVKIRPDVDLFPDDDSFTSVNRIACFDSCTALSNDPTTHFYDSKNEVGASIGHLSREITAANCTACIPTFVYRYDRHYFYSETTFTAKHKSLSSLSSLVSLLYHHSMPTRKSTNRQRNRSEITMSNA